MSDSGQPSFNRRSFLKGIGSSVVALSTTSVASLAAEVDKSNPEREQGPDPVPVTLNVNGSELKLELEPRVTLLDALRNFSDKTGAKEVCDRATCGACTVLIDGVPIYACMKLAIEAQGHEITTIEGLSSGSTLTDVQKSFVECDALMCGFCTPGFVMSVTALLKKNPKPSAEEVKVACSGNLCRCGTYPRVLQAALKAAGVEVADNCEIVTYERLA